MPNPSSPPRWNPAHRTQSLEFGRPLQQEALHRIELKLEPSEHPVEGHPATCPRRSRGGHLARALGESRGPSSSRIGTPRSSHSLNLNPGEYARANAWPDAASSVAEGSTCSACSPRHIGTITTWSGVSRGGRTQPLLLPCVMITPPSIRVLMPHGVDEFQFAARDPRTNVESLGCCAQVVRGAGLKSASVTDHACTFAGPRAPVSFAVDHRHGGDLTAATSAYRPSASNVSAWASASSTVRG